MVNTLDLMDVFFLWGGIDTHIRLDLNERTKWTYDKIQDSPDNNAFFINSWTHLRYFHI